MKFIRSDRKIYVVAIVFESSGNMASTLISSQRGARVGMEFREQVRRHESPSGGLLVVGEHPHRPGPPLELAIGPLERVGRAELRPERLGEDHVGDNVIARGVHQVGKFGMPAVHLFWLPSFSARQSCPATPRRKSSSASLERRGCALPERCIARCASSARGSTESSRRRTSGSRWNAGAVTVGDHQFHAPQASVGETVRQRQPEGLGLGGPQSRPREPRGSSQSPELPRWRLPSRGS